MVLAKPEKRVCVAAGETLSRIVFTRRFVVSRHHAFAVIPLNCRRC